MRSRIDRLFFIVGLVLACMATRASEESMLSVPRIDGSPISAQVLRAKPTAPAPLLVVIAALVRARP